MVYLLDASVLMTASNQYYPIDRVPEFWDWLEFQATEKRLAIPIEIIEEIRDGPKDAEKDLLYAWLQKESTKIAILLDEDVDIAIVRRIVAEGYAPDLTDDQVEQLGRDPFLMAHAAAKPDRCVVTTEVSKPSKIRQNRHIPDVCKTLGIKCCDPFAMYKTLNFNTNWKT